MDNRTIARQLLDWAHSLEAEHANLYRIKAYRRAAETILGLDRSVEEGSGDGRKRSSRRRNRRTDFEKIEKRPHRISLV